MKQRMLIRKRLQQLAVVAVLGLAVVALSQCRSVSESLTGVDLRSAGRLSVRSGCHRRCNTQFKAGLIAEEQRYQKEKRSCGRNYFCKKEADREHAMKLRELIQDKKRCKRSCYNEGAGSGA